jgi:hypothetical protein
VRSSHFYQAVFKRSGLVQGGFLSVIFRETEVSCSADMAATAIPDPQKPRPDATVSSDPEALKSALEVQMLEAEIAKAKADKTKADLEAAELLKPWYQKPSILQPMAAIAIAILTGAIGYSNGWFQTKLESLHNAQDKAELELQQLNDQKSDYKTRIAKQNDTIAQLGSQVTSLGKERDDLIARLQQTLASAQAHPNTNKDASDIRQTIANLDKLKNDNLGGGLWRAGGVLVIQAQNARTGKPISPLSVDYGYSANQPKSKNLIISLLRMRSPHYCTEPGEFTCKYTLTQNDVDAGKLVIRVDAPKFSGQEFTIYNGSSTFTAILSPQSGQQ